MRKPEYSDSVAGRLSEMPVAQAPLRADQRDRILAMACEKAGLEPVQDEEVPAPAVHKAPRRPLRKVGMFAAAVAAVCALSLGVAAVGPALLQLGKGDIHFFNDAPDPATAENALDAPHGSFSTAAEAMAAHTVTIGQTCESNGLSMTLESVSMDTAAMNLFLTIRKDNLIPDLLNRPGGSDYFGQSDLSALLKKCSGNRTSQTAGSSGDQCCFSFERK